MVGTGYDDDGEALAERRKLVREMDEFATAVLECLAASWPSTRKHERHQPMAESKGVSNSDGSQDEHGVEESDAQLLLHKENAVEYVAMVAATLAQSSDSSAAAAVHRAAVECLQVLAEGATPGLLAALLPTATSELMLGVGRAVGHPRSSEVRRRGIQVSQSVASPTMGSKERSLLSLFFFCFYFDLSVAMQVLRTMTMVAKANPEVAKLISDPAAGIVTDLVSWVQTALSDQNANVKAAAQELWESTVASLAAHK